jgi:hypothetical protein
MADFSDKEDRMLIQLVHKQTVLKGKRISWRDIARRIKSRKSPEQLRQRVVCLKKRFGNVLSSFPRWYFLEPVSRKSQQSNSLQRKRKSENTVQKVASEGKPDKAHQFEQS